VYVYDRGGTTLKSIVMVKSECALQTVPYNVYDTCARVQNKESKNDVSRTRARACMCVCVCVCERVKATGRRDTIVAENNNNKKRTRNIRFSFYYYARYVLRSLFRHTRTHTHAHTMCCVRSARCRTLLRCCRRPVRVIRFIRSFRRRRDARRTGWSIFPRSRLLIFETVNPLRSFRFGHGYKSALPRLGHARTIVNSPRFVRNTALLSATKTPSA